MFYSFKIIPSRQGCTCISKHFSAGGGGGATCELNRLTGSLCMNCAIVFTKYVTV